MAKSKIGRARQLAKRALRRANQRRDEAGMAAAKAKLRTIAWEQVHRINSWRRAQGYRESEQLGERMARDRDD